MVIMFGRICLIGWIHLVDRGAVSLWFQMMALQLGIAIGPLSVAWHPFNGTFMGGCLSCYCDCNQTVAFELSISVEELTESYVEQTVI